VRALHLTRNNTQPRNVKACTLWQALASQGSRPPKYLTLLFLCCLLDGKAKDC
jgi:hypothetical protein